MNITKSPQIKTDHPFTQRGYRFGISRFATLLGLLLMFYYGYCFGLWGRKSLFLQYLFQCNCPTFSEEWRYPRSVDVIVPACRYVSSTLSPSGNFLYVQEEASSQIPSYFLDFRNNEKKPSFIPAKSTVYFLTDDLLFLSLGYGHDDYQGGEYILDRTTGKQYPIRRFRFFRSDAYINRKPNLSLLADELRDANNVFLIGNKTIVALATDFQTSPEHNFYIHQVAFPGYETNRAEQFLQQNNIDYHFVPDRFPGEALSPDGRFIARTDGIYLTGTGRKIVEAYAARGFFHDHSGKHFSVRGWINDSSGAIYSKFLKPCLIEVSGYCFVAEVSQPLLKLKVPEDHLLPAKTP